MSQWQPISTAPKDGSKILVAMPEELVSIVYWNPNMKQPRGHLFFPWVCEFGGNAWRSDIPTHWMPLPSPPETSISEAS